MKKYVIVLLLSLYAASGPAQTEYRIDLQPFEASMKRALNEWQIPGMAIAIVKDGDIIYEKGIGVRKTGTTEKVDAHTLFAIASNTKAFTAGSLAKLVDQGRLSWDDYVIDYLPWFRLYDPYVTSHFTIRDLLTHRSGLKTFSGDLLWYKTNYTTEEIIRRARHLKPEYEFRGKFGYSNIMYAAAGEVLKAITDTSWQDYVRAHFLEPLGMDRTTTTVKVLDETPNVASPHDYVDGEFQSLPYLSWDNMAPAAALNSSVHDMAQWIKMQLNRGMLEGKRYFSEKVQWEMWSPQTPLDVSKTVSKIWKGRQFRAYGLGWQLEDYRGLKLVSHGGGADGMISKTCLVPEENLGFVIFTNSINALPSALMYQLIDNYLNIEERNNWNALYLNHHNSRKQSEKDRVARLKESRDATGKPAMALEAYTGTYGGKLYGEAEVRKEAGQLLVDFLPANQLVGDLKYHHANVFTIKLRNRPLPMGTVQFIPDKEGTIEEMKIDIPNPDFFFDELKFMRR